MLGNALTTTINVIRYVSSFFAASKICVILGTETNEPTFLFVVGFITKLPISTLLFIPPKMYNLAG